MTEQKRKVLVVDDEPTICSSLALLLRDSFDVESVSCGEDALQLLDGHAAPDLILLDVMMPGLSGLEVLATIRESREKKISEVPVIMITAKSTTDDIDAAIELGANSYIVKPFRPANLVEKVSEIFQAALNN